MDYAEFIRNRITELRLLKNVSEYQMSLDLGHSKSYIQGISSGKALPSMSEFIVICEYFGISPRDFFDDGTSNPMLMQKLFDRSKSLRDSDIELLLNIIDRFK